MESEKVAGILAAIIASIVLVVAFAYGPIGQFGKPAAKPAVAQPAAVPPPQPTTGPPGSRGPIIREVPQ